VVGEGIDGEEGGNVSSIFITTSGDMVAGGFVPEQAAKQIT
jgi:hypothetical protein